MKTLACLLVLLSSSAALANPLFRLLELEAHSARCGVVSPRFPASFKYELEADLAMQALDACPNGSISRQGQAVITRKDAGVDECEFYQAQFTALGSFRCYDN